MENFCSKLLSFMKLEITNYVILTVLCIIAIIMCAFLRDNKTYKPLLWLSGICLIITTILSANAIIPIYKDYCNKSFVQLDNVTIVSPLGGFDSSGTAEISVYTTGGNVIRLITTEQLPNGEYKASLVYAERSNYLVYWEIAEQ